ncbi:STM4504/CBY_0614 family protein [Erythrobacter sp.]|uniref:STM4504/CBY_0614 family protein n=1 Tax=Erythrobacter sp. TaxID=1042 RepID=UPI00311FED02
MGIFDLFSKRQADAEKSGDADTYQYDSIPMPLRVQVHQIALEALGRVGEYSGHWGGKEDNDLWAEMERIYLRERGRDGVANGDFAGERILQFMRACSTEEWLDLLDLIAVGLMIAGKKNEYWRETWQVKQDAGQAREELNYRLRQAGVGYQIEEARLMRVDSEYLHAEVVKPALTLLSGKGFEGPRQEFLSAHKHYREGEHRQAVGMAANAVESTFKAIFDQKGWAYNKGARISDLVKVARERKLWPDYLDASFDQLVATLQSGLPKIRDNDASHGQGASPKNVPSYVAAYALHLAASKIVFIAEAAK